MIQRNDLHGRRLPMPIVSKIRQFQLLLLKSHHTRLSEFSELQKIIGEIAEDLSAFAKRTQPSLDLGRIASLLNVRVETKPPAGAILGQLIPSTKGFIAVIRATSEEESRHTIAHECGHILFYGSNGCNSPKRLVPASTSVQEEELCEVFARSLLMPRDWMANLVDKRPSIPEILKVSMKFGVPIRTLVQRLLYDFNSSPEFSEWQAQTFHAFFREPGDGFSMETFAPSESWVASPDLAILLRGKAWQELPTAVGTSLGLSEADFRIRGDELWFMVSHRKQGAAKEPVQLRLF